LEYKRNDPQKGMLIIVKAGKQDEYHKTINLTSLLDKNLSFKAKGLHAYIMTRPDNWKLWISSLTSTSTDGETAIRSSINELIKNHYLYRTSMRDEKKRITNWVHICFSTPTIINEDKLEKLVLDFHEIDNPEIENQGHSNKIYSNKIYSNKKNIYPKIKNHRLYKNLSNWFLKERASITGGKDMHSIWDTNKSSPKGSVISNSVDTLDKLVRIDGFNFQKEITPVIKWVLNNNFWKANLRSLVVLRHKSKNGLTKFENIMSAYLQSQPEKHKPKVLRKKKEPTGTIRKTPKEEFYYS